MRELILDGGPVAREDVIAAAAGDAFAVLAPAAAHRMAESVTLVERVIERGETVYGVTTGFGALANTRVAPEDSADLQVSLLRSHAAGVGPPLPPEQVRAMLLLRARTLAQGHSGVRPEVAERLLELLKRNLLPVVPSQGSVGASGDLAPFAHLALPVIGEGLLAENGAVRPAAEVLERHGMAPLTLRPKEGLSLLNGTEGMLAMGVLCLHRAELIAEAADAACALTVEAVLGSTRPFEARVHELRRHPGQVRSAARISALVAGSAIGASHRDDFGHAVQDAYSIRCAPQVHGAALDVLDQAGTVFDRELESVVDNPIVFPADGDVLSAGNFHGQPLAFALDFMAIAVTELGSISERRSDRILDPDRSSGLPAFLATRPGLNSGFMLAQYTAAALVGENKVLSHPASVESIPTSGLQEDHVSMGWGAGRKLEQVLANTARVVAVELLCGAEGVERRPFDPATGTARVVAAIRELVAPLTDDRPIGGDIEAVAALIESGELHGVLTFLAS